ncbi:hypothetical protein C4D60_Mb02t13690 [Musa balbisiana]|uniref:Uncharacterized protein n=1 Tax=Musa balbisiana TaxID=52838 RepID=A0A4S8IAK1_MUSBA|nr:hypothetical protein C4D60_Mb02t13690 [Musa balbisiana]
MKVVREESRPTDKIQTDEGEASRSTDRMMWDDGIVFHSHMLWKSESSFFLQFLLLQQHHHHQEREGSGIPALLTLLPVTVASRVPYLSFVLHATSITATHSR